MIVRLWQYVDIEEINFPLSWTKEFNSSVIPSIGMKICDPLWKDPYDYKVCEVIINYEDDECDVTLEKFNDTIPSKKREEMKHIAELHGWKCSINW